MTLGEVVSEAVEGVVVAACFLRYRLAVRLGDNFASPTSEAAHDVAHAHMSHEDADRLWRLDPPSCEQDLGDCDDGFAAHLRRSHR